jgi:hypothetical protein
MVADKSAGERAPYAELGIRPIRDTQCCRGPFRTNPGADLIGSTTTQTGLRVEAKLYTGTYPTRVEVSAQQMAALCLRPNK